MFIPQLQKSIDLHGKRVSQLFAHYGYKIPKPSAQNVLDACIVLGPDFNDSLANILDQDNRLNSFTGGKAKEWLQKGIGLLKAKKTGEPPIVPTVENKDSKKEGAETPTEEERIMGLNSTLFYALLISLVLVAGLVIVKAS